MRGASPKGIPTGTTDRNFLIVGMNALFHGDSQPKLDAPYSILRLPMLQWSEILFLYLGPAKGPKQEGCAGTGQRNRKMYAFYLSGDDEESLIVIELALSEVKKHPWKQSARL